MLLITRLGGVGDLAEGFLRFATSVEAGGAPGCFRVRNERDVTEMQCHATDLLAFANVSCLWFADHLPQRPRKDLPQASVAVQGGKHKVPADHTEREEDKSNLLQTQSSGFHTLTC